MFGENSEEEVDRKRQRDVGEEAVGARSRKAEIASSDKQVEECNLDHTVFRSWCPHCVEGRVESWWHVGKPKDEGAAPTVGVDYVWTLSEQEKDEEKGTPIIVIKDSKTKMTMAKVAPSKGVESYAAEVVKNAIGSWATGR